MKPDDLSSVPTTVVARLFGYGPRSIDAWRAQIPPEAGIWVTTAEKLGGAKKAAVRWDLPKVLAWRLEKISAERLKAPGPAPARKELDPLEAEHLRRLRAENDKRDGLLVNRAEMERQWAKAGSELRQRLEVLGRRHGVTVANDLARVMADLARSMHGLLGKA